MKNGFLKFMVCAAMLLGIQQLATAGPCTTWSLTSPSVKIGDILSGSANDPCTAYGLQFDMFSAFIGAGFPAIAGVPSAVPFSVSAVFNANGVIQFSDNETAAQDFDIAFRITPGINRMILNMSTGNGITETACAVLESPTLPCTGANILGTGSVSGPGTTTINIGPSPTGVVWILKDVSGSSTFSQQVVPEPLSISLMGAGLLAIGLIRRRRRS